MTYSFVPQLKPSPYTPDSSCETFPLSSTSECKERGLMDGVVHEKGKKKGVESIPGRAGKSTHMQNWRQSWDFKVLLGGKFRGWAPGTRNKQPAGNLGDNEPAGNKGKTTGINTQGSNQEDKTRQDFGEENTEDTLKTKSRWGGDKAAKLTWHRWQQ